MYIDFNREVVLSLVVSNLRLFGSYGDCWENSVSYCNLSSEVGSSIGCCCGWFCGWFNYYCVSISWVWDFIVSGVGEVYLFRVRVCFFLFLF